MILECNFIAECDECGEEEKFDVNADNNGFGSVELNRVLKGSGWKIVRSVEGPKMMCDACSGKKQR